MSTSRGYSDPSLLFEPPTSTLRIYHSTLFDPIELGPASRWRQVPFQSGAYMYDVNGRPTSKTLPIYAMSLVAFLKTYLSPGNIMISADKALYPSPSATQSQSDSVIALSSSFILVLERAGLRVISLTPPLKKSPSFNHRTCIGVEISVVGSRPPHASLALPISRSRLRGVFKLKLKGWLRCFEPRNCRVLSGRRVGTERNQNDRHVSRQLVT